MPRSGSDSNDSLNKYFESQFKKLEASKKHSAAESKEDSDSDSEAASKRTAASDGNTKALRAELERMLKVNAEEAKPLPTPKLPPSPVSSAPKPKSSKSPNTSRKFQFRRKTKKANGNSNTAATDLATIQVAAEAEKDRRKICDESFTESIRSLPDIS